MAGSSHLLKEIRLRMTREGWSLQIDDGEGLQDFPWVVAAGWFTEAAAQREGEQHQATAPHDGAA